MMVCQSWHWNWWHRSYCCPSPHPFHHHSVGWFFPFGKESSFAFVKPLLCSSSFACSFSEGPSFFDSPSLEPSGGTLSFCPFWPGASFFSCSFWQGVSFFFACSFWQGVSFFFGCSFGQGVSFFFGCSFGQGVSFFFCCSFCQGVSFFFGCSFWQGGSLSWAFSWMAQLPPTQLHGWQLQLLQLPGQLSLLPAQQLCFLLGFASQSSTVPQGCQPVPFLGSSLDPCPSGMGGGATASWPPLVVPPTTLPVPIITIVPLHWDNFLSRYRLLTFWQGKVFFAQSLLSREAGSDFSRPPKGPLVEKKARKKTL